MPALLAAAWLTLLPVALALVAWFCVETRGRYLRSLDAGIAPEPPTSA